MNKCIGVFGRLFGHKYIKNVWDWTYKSECCWRCGKRKG